MNIAFKMTGEGVLALKQAARVYRYGSRWYLGLRYYYTSSI